ASSWARGRRLRAVGPGRPPSPYWKSRVLRRQVLDLGSWRRGRARAQRSFGERTAGVASRRPAKERLEGGLAPGCVEEGHGLRLEEPKRVPCGTADGAEAAHGGAVAGEPAQRGQRLARPRGLQAVDRPEPDFGIRVPKPGLEGDEPIPVRTPIGP